MLLQHSNRGRQIREKKEEEYFKQCNSHAIYKRITGIRQEIKWLTKKRKTAWDHSFQAEIFNEDDSNKLHYDYYLKSAWNQNGPIYLNLFPGLTVNNS